MGLDEDFNQFAATFMNPASRPAMPRDALASQRVTSRSWGARESGFIGLKRKFDPAVSASPYPPNPGGDGGGGGEDSYVAPIVINSTLWQGVDFGEYHLGTYAEDRAQTWENSINFDSGSVRAILPFIGQKSAKCLSTGHIGDDPVPEDEDPYVIFSAGDNNSGTYKFAWNTPTGYLHAWWNQRVTDEVYGGDPAPNTLISSVSTDTAMDFEFSGAVGTGEQSDDDGYIVTIEDIEPPETPSITVAGDSRLSRRTISITGLHWSFT